MRMILKAAAILLALAPLLLENAFAQEGSNLRGLRFHGFPQLNPFFPFRKNVIFSPAPSLTCLSAIETKLAVDCFRSEYDANSPSQRSGASQDLNPPQNFTTLEAPFDVAPKVQYLDISSLELLAILAALPEFQSTYNELNRRRIRIRDEGDFIAVWFYDPDPPLGCRGNCGRGSMTVILSKPSLAYVRTVFSR
jgi:hypothetical protein